MPPVFVTKCLLQVTERVVACIDTATGRPGSRARRAGLAPRDAEALATITAPTVVIHGSDDPLVPKDGGEDTAATIPGAELHLIPGMGHNLPAPLIVPVCDLIERATARARLSA